MATTSPSTELIVPPLSAEISQPNTFAPRNIDEAFNFAQMILLANMAPKSYQEAGSVEKIVVAMQFGMEVGLQPMQSLRSIAVINGMPSLWGDAALALVKKSGKLEYIVEQDFNTIRTNGMATCIVKRRGEPEVIRTFSLQDAREAKIIDNAVWKTYPQRMLQMRARAFALRDVFPDVMNGLSIGEEAQDYPVVDVTPTEAPKQQRVATVTGQQANPAPAANQAANPAPETTASEAKPDEPVGLVKAKMWYDTYVATGWKIEEAKAYLLRTFGTTDSRQIPTSRYEEAMRWARNEVDPNAAGENLDAEPSED